MKKVHINTKKDLRERILTQLRNQKEEERQAKSSVILKKLFNMPEISRAQTIFFYEPFDGEVDTVEMIKQAQQIGKKIALPKILQGQRRIVPILLKYLEDNLETGPYGIKQPKTAVGKTLHAGDIDTVIVPGIAFDKDKYRLGRGGGYYDRFIQLLPSDIPTVGLAFDFQIVDTLPQKQPHDMPVKHVLTN